MSYKYLLIFVSAAILTLVACRNSQQLPPGLPDRSPDLYKSRWEVETFFKWIKQNLTIKSFLGTSQNAVMTQIWAAMIYYPLLSFIKFQTKCRHSLHELTRIVGELLLDHISLIDTLTIPFTRYKQITQQQGQLSLKPEILTGQF